MSRAPSLTRDLTTVLAVATVLTTLMAWPLVVSPTEMIFGSELVGRQHDAYTVIQQISGPLPTGLYTQPATDWIGWLFARVLHPVAAYNLLVLLTFPLSAAATYALSRYLFASHQAAMIAALAFAFAPVHLAHAAYHPHIAQTQWIPLYLLALFAFIDRPIVSRFLWLSMAGGGAVFSNYYGGLLCAVITPVAGAAYWWTSPRAARRWRHLVVPASLLALVPVLAIAGISVLAPRVLAFAMRQGFPASDVGLHSARWWAFFVPPTDHAVLGSVASRLIEHAGVTVELLEQQLYLGYALLALTLVAIVTAVTRWHREPALRTIAALAAIGSLAAIVAIGPGTEGCPSAWWAPACRLHDWLPMFRSYARFGIVVQLTVAVGAGLGAQLLWQRSRAIASVVGALLVVAIFEFWPLPWRAHDVLPTAAHRWLANEEPQTRILDCVPSDPTSATMMWLMHGRLAVEFPPVVTCQDPDLGPKLAALGYTHILVRANRERPASISRPADFALERAFADASVYRVMAPLPIVVVLRTNGFNARETAGEDHWQWMGPTGHWIVRRTGAGPLNTGVEIDLEPLGGPRRLRIEIDGQPAGEVALAPGRNRYRLGPWPLTPGDHTFTFVAREPAVRPRDLDTSSMDDRLLTIAFHAPTWIGHADPR